MALQSGDKLLVSRSGTHYQESWENLTTEADVVLNLSSVTDNLSGIRSDTGIGGAASAANITAPGAGFTNGTFYNVTTASTNGRGTGLILPSIVISGGALTSFVLLEGAGGTGYVEGETVGPTVAGANDWELTITKVGDGGIPLSALYAPKDITTLPFLP